MQVRTITVLTDADMDIYWIGWCMYGLLMFGLLQVWTVNG